jgi:pimeloyl-ACP methyl ester carboxylesterase
MRNWPLPESYTFRDQTVRYHVTGDGPPLVLVHGTPFSSYVWHRIAPYLADTRTVYYYDLLGYGQSEQRDGQDVSLGVQNVLLAELLAHWALKNPDVIAHDFGGATSLRAHLIDQCDYRSLTLIDPVALAPWGSPFVRHVREHIDAFAGLPPYIHEAVVNAYVRGAIPARFRTPNSRPTLHHGSAQRDKPRSTGRSHKWTSAIPTTSKRAIRRCAARCRLCGVNRTNGFRSNAAVNWLARYRQRAFTRCRMRDI